MGLIKAIGLGMCCEIISLRTDCVYALKKSIYCKPHLWTP